MTLDDVSRQVTAASFHDVALTAWPFTPDQIDEGDPHARGAILWRSTDETRASGFWECTSGRFSRTYAWTETAVILSGSAVVTVAEAEHQLAPGALLILPVGVTASWTIEKRVRKAFHLAADSPLPV
jgi:uncharacterized cupin superfamily protein